MNILLVVNGRSGRGRGNAAATRLSSLLANHIVSRIDTPRHISPDHSWLTPRLASAELCVVVGGDGTLHALLQPLIESKVPVFHAPTGTENLFARQFESFASHIDTIGAKLIEAIASPHVLEVDVGKCTGIERHDRAFTIMLSVGPDASVITRLDRVRTGAITHLDYLSPILAECRRPYLPRLTVTVDGSPLCENARGMLLVANSRQYALRADPCPQASMTDGLLDVLFIPARNPLQIAAALVRTRFNAALNAPRARGQHIHFSMLDEDLVHCIQADGEAFKLEPRSPGRVDGRIEILPAALRVLTRVPKLRPA